MTKLLLITGETLEVDAPVDEVGRLLQDAARSASGTLAWLEAGSGEPLGVNPNHVVTVSTGES
jgi:hypothetical protein